MYETALLPIFISLFLAALLCLVSKNRKVIEVSSILASGIALVGSVVVALQVARFGIYAPLPFFSVDALGAVVMLIIACVGFAATAYSIEYLRQETTKNIIGFTGVSRPRSRAR